MNKKIAYILVSIFVAIAGIGIGVGVYNSFNPTSANTEIQSESDVNDEDLMKKAVAYVKTIYKDAAKETPKDFERIGVVPVGKAKFTVEWSVDVSEDIIKIVKQDSGLVLIDINEEIGDETPYVLTATISDDKGNSKSLSWDHVIPAKITGSYQDIVDMAYKLAPGESLPNEATLQGSVTAINTPYDKDYKNVTVTIVVEGREDKPIQCYRLKSGDADASKIEVGDLITVTGTLKNYNGTIEFDAGCTLDENLKGQGKILRVSGTMLEIVEKAYALKDGESLKGLATLSGSVISVDSEWSDKFNNITVTIVVDGSDKEHKIQCYRLKSGDADAKNIKAGDWITVTGTLKNYKGTIEFDAGCVLDEWVKDGGSVEIEKEPEVEVVVPAAPEGGIKTGDKVVIYNPKYEVALTTTKPEDGYKYEGTDAIVSGDSLIYGADACVYIVEITDEDYYRFKHEETGEYLSAYKSEKGFINLGYDGEYLDWELIELDNGTCNIKNAKCPADSKYGPYFLEYYYGWTVYAEEDEDAATGWAYQLSLYVLPEEVVPAKAEEALVLVKSDLAKLDLSVTGENTLPSTISIKDTTFDVTWKVETDYTDNAKVEGKKLTLKASETADIPFKLVATVTDQNDATNTVTEKLSYTIDKVAVPTAADAAAELEITDPLTETIKKNNTVNDYTFTVTWDVIVEDQFKENVKIEITTEAGKEVKKLVVDPSTEADITYKLVATVTNNGNTNDTAEKTWEKTVEKIDASNEVAPTKNVLELTQSNLSNKKLYFNGKMNGYYLDTSENVEDAVAVYTEEAEGGVRLYFMDDKIKTYIDVYASNRVQLTTDKDDAAIYVEYNNSYAVVYEDLYYFLGTSSTSTYTTLAATKVDGSNLIAKYVNVPATYKLTVNQENRNEVLYFNGKVKSSYDDYLLSTTTNSDAAASIYMKTVTGGAHFYFMNDGSETYIDIYKDGEYVSAGLTTETPEGVWVFDKETNMYVVIVEGTKYFIGTSDTYTTLCATSIEELEESFVSTLEDTAIVVANKNKVTITRTTKDVMSVYHGKNECWLYLDGGISGNYLTTVTDISDAAEVCFEETDGGFFMKLKNETGENYVAIEEYENSYGSLSGKMVLEASNPSQVWYLDEEKDIYVTKEGDTVYCLGTSNSGTHKTMGAVKLTSYNHNFVMKLEEPTPHKLNVYQAYNGYMLYFNGKTTEDYNYRLATTTKVDEAVDIYAEEVANVEGGVRFYFMNGTTKTYIDMYLNTEDYKGYLRLTETPEAVYTYDEEANTYVVTFQAGTQYEAKYYIGTNYNYDTLEAKKFSNGHSNYVAFVKLPDAILKEEE